MAKNLVVIILLALTAPAWGQQPDAFDTPQWHAQMRALNTSLHPDAVQWANAIRYYSSAEGFAVWDYFHAAMVAVDDPALSDAKMDEFIAASDAWMSDQTIHHHYTHGAYQYAYIYSRVKAAGRLTPELDARWSAAMKLKAAHVVWHDPTLGTTTRREDSDMAVGHWALALTTDHVLGTNYLGTPGGVRIAEAVALYVDASSNGEWIESTEYNLLTVRELLTAAGFVGLDKHPKIKAFVRATGEQHRWHHTPEPIPRTVYQWGDNERHGSPVPYWRCPLYYTIQALGGDPDGHLLHLAKAMQPQVDSAFYHAHDHAIASGFDPRNLPEAAKVVHPVGVRQNKNGLTLFRTPDTLVAVFNPVYFAPWYVDHQMQSWDWVEYRNGEWKQGHPISYMPWSRNNNGSEAHGFSQPPTRSTGEAKLIEGGFEIELKASGPPVIGGYDPPPGFITDWTRKHVYKNGVMATTDRLAAVPPIPWWSYYAIGVNYDWIQQQKLAPLAQFFHAPPGREVTQIDGGFTWLTESGLPRKLLTNAPQLSTAPVLIGTNIGTYVDPSQEGGTLMQLGAEYEITTVTGDADNPAVVMPGPPGPPPVVEPGPVTPPPVVVVPPVDPPALPIRTGGTVLDQADYVGEWVDWKATGINGGLHYAGPGENAATWTFTVEPGRYLVAATWPEYPNRATNTAYQFAGISKLVNQEKAPASFVAGEVRWHTLGEVEATGKLTVVLDAKDADEYVIADAIRIERIGDLPSTDVEVRGVIRGTQLIIELP
jgi:hypothetical protein